MNNQTMLYNEHDVIRRTKLSRTTIFRYVRDGLMPSPFYLNPENKTGKRWYAYVIENYISECADLNQNGLKQSEEQGHE